MEATDLGRVVQKPSNQGDSRKACKTAKSHTKACEGRTQDHASEAPIALYFVIMVRQLGPAHRFCSRKRVRNRTDPPYSGCGPGGRGFESRRSPYGAVILLAIFHRRGGGGVARLAREPGGVRLGRGGCTFGQRAHRSKVGSLLQSVVGIGGARFSLDGRRACGFIRDFTSGIAGLACLASRARHAVRRSVRPPGSHLGRSPKTLRSGVMPP